jgi:hypothetical protein
VSTASCRLVPMTTTDRDTTDIADRVRAQRERKRRRRDE